MSPMMVYFIQRAVKLRPSGRGYKAHSKNTMSSCVYFVDFFHRPAILNSCNDNNAALNILAAGQAVSACGAGRVQAPAMKQEPTYGTSDRMFPVGIPSL